MSLVSILDDTQKYRKAIAIAVIGLIFLVLKNYGIIQDTTLVEFIQIVVGTSAVYQVANK